ncbi:MAG: metal ABC transporter permease [Candidatus Thermoplasmatota archaeon]|nr:metal ABC transporter permease [Candidatus Thermoplasmatota archaeon]MEC9075281.1 metal ABC transporter permease [Candidatus Thermoplasmatota archaeon]
MGAGSALMELISPVLERIAPYVPGEIFPHFFSGLFQNALVASVMVTVVAGFLGSFLLVRNLSLIGDGLAHVSFGGICVGLVLGSSSPLWFALLFSTIAAILIFEMQRAEIVTGDASIAIFLTGMLAFGLVILRLYGGGVTIDVEGYLFGSVLLIDEKDLDLIVIISLFSIISLLLLKNVLLATTIDQIAAQVQGIPTRAIGLFFSVTTAAVVVSMVQVVGTLLVTALLVTPAATAQMIGKSFRSCLIWTQFFGLTSVFIGLYLSSEMSTGSGSMIAVVAATIFGIVGLYQTQLAPLLNPGNNS